MNRVTSANERTVSLSSMSFVAAACLSIIAGCDGGLSQAIPIPQAAIQKAVDAYLPISSDDYIDEDVPVKVVAGDAAILLEEGEDRIGIRMSVTVQLPSEAPQALVSPPKLDLPSRPGPPVASKAKSKRDQKTPEALHGTIDAWVGIRYEPSTASFYCHTPEIAELSFKELPPQFDRPVREVIGKLLAKYLAENSVYQLKGDSQVTNLATATLKSVSVADGTLYVTVGN